MIKFRVWVAIFLICQSIWALSLKEAVLETVGTNPLILEREKNYNATKEDVTIAKSGWLPKVDYIGNLGHAWGKQDYSGNGWSNYDLYEHTLLLTQNLFDGWSTTHQINTQEARLLAAAYNYIEVVEDTGYRLVNYYIEVVKNRELLKIAKENIDINQAIYDKVEKLYSGGLTTKSELEKAASSLALAHSNYVVQKNNLQDALYQFKYFYGKEVDPELLQVPASPSQIPQNYEEGKRFALDHNPSILVQRFNIKVAKEDYEEKRSRYYPKVDLRARGSWNYDANGDNYGHDELYRASIGLSYNLFNGFADRAAIQKGISKVQQELVRHQELCRRTVESYDLSWNAYTHLAEKLKYLQQYKLHAVNTLRLYSKEYEMGRRSLLDLLSAQNDLINAKSQIVSTKYNYLFSKYRILDAMGTMVSTIVGGDGRYVALVGLSEKDESGMDTLPLDQLEENDRFLNSLEKRVKQNHGQY